MRRMSCVLSLLMMAAWSVSGCTAVRPAAGAAPFESNAPTGALPANPVRWSTDAVDFVAKDFYLEANGQRYGANVASVERHSDPGTATYRTLEVTWQEHGTEMRVNLYFAANATHWWVNEIRTYNGRTPGDWITYTGEFFKTPQGAPFVGNLDITSGPGNGGQSVAGKVHLQNVTIQPKALPVVRPNDAGPVHVLQPLTGTTLVAGQPFTVQAQMNVPYAVQSVTVELHDLTSGFKQEWSVEAAFPTGSLVLDQVFEVPQDAPPGTEYRLMVGALPVPTAGLTAAEGYSLQVNVVSPPFVNRWRSGMSNAGSGAVATRRDSTRPRYRRDVAGILADPQLLHALHAAIDAFVHAIMINRSDGDHL